MSERLELLPVSGENLTQYTQFCDCYENALAPYMSRIHPHGLGESGQVDGELLTQQTAAHRLCWWYILLDGRAEGSVWLELEEPGSSWATLGIFLLGEAARGRGVGRRAVTLAIQEGAAWLNVDEVRLHVRAANSRAMACYRSCGFVETGRYLKGVAAPIQVVEMRKRIRRETGETR